MLHLGRPSLLLFAALAACAAVQGCSGRRGRVDIPAPVPAEPIGVDPAAAEDAGAPATAEAPTGEVAITPLAPPPQPERMPRLSFVAPKQGDAVPVDKADAFEVKLDIRDWFIEPGDHIHLV